MSKTFVDKETNLITYQLTQSCDAKFLIVAAEGGKVIEINHFGSFKDAKKFLMRLQVIMAASRKP